jgi:DNA repair exonuclease SbcCD nuclease subunit
MKFIHTADVHLDSPLLGLERYDGAPIDKMRGATRRALENLVELAVNERVDFVLTAGDLYDGDWKDYNTGLFFVSQMTKLRDSGIKVIIVTGNHDAASQITKNLRIPDNCRMLSMQKPQSIILEDVGVAIHGQGFLTRAVTDNLAVNYPKAIPELFNIGLLHTCLDGREGHEPYAPCTLDELLSRGYGYWALGHVHKREVIRQEPWIVFPGNSQGRNVRETGAKGCMLVSVSDRSVTNVEFTTLDVFRWSLIDVDVAGSTKIDDILNKLDKVLKREVKNNDGMPLALRISLSGSSRLHGQILAKVEHLKNEIRGCAIDAGNGNIWVEKVSIDTSGMSDPETLMMRDDALGGLLRSISDLQYDDKALESILGEFGDLFRKLPAEYLDDTEAIHPERKKSVSKVVDDVKHMLLTRILSSGGDR